jgi:hypothetical protein
MASREAARSEEQFLHLAKRAGLTINDEVAEGEALAKTLLAAFSDHLGVETSPGSRIYRLAGGYTGHLDKDAHIKAPRLLVAAEIVEVQGKALTVKLNNVTAIDEAWLRDLFPDDLTSGRSARYDSVNRRVMNMEETRFRSLVLASKERGEPDETQAASLLAAEVIAGHKAFFDARTIPSVAYTDPEIAWMGLTETQAQAQGIEYDKAVFPWAASGRALATGRDEGMTKALFDKKTRRLLGAAMTGVNAGELIAEAVLALEMGADSHDIGLTIHPHPTLSETLFFAAEMAEGSITDLYVPKK